MSYSDFTLKSAIALLQLKLDTQNLFTNIPKITPSDRLVTDLNENVTLATAINTEKARSELIITAVL